MGKKKFIKFLYRDTNVSRKLEIQTPVSLHVTKYDTEDGCAFNAVKDNQTVSKGLNC